ncbi:penicillin-binding transpeptidase domain-containing protein [Desulfoplanes sp.]
MARKKSIPGKDWSGVKIVAVAVVCTLCLMGLWARAYYVQIVRGKDLGAKAQRQYWAFHSVRGERGEILDTRGRLLAKSVPSYSLYLRPSEINDRARTVARLHRILGKKKGRLARLVSKNKNFVWVARHLGDREVALIRREALPGIYLKDDRTRIYPQGHIAGQLLGFVGIDGEGLEGLEKSLDTLLGGSAKREAVQRDAAGHRMYNGGRETSVDGASVTLTLDSVIQSAAEDALAEAVETFHGRKGVCLVVEVQTGAILAWAQYPFFDPNQYAQSTPGLWKNRMCLDLVEPGSTFKPFVAAAALQQEICTSGSRFYCEQGRWRVDRHTIRDTHEYGELSVEEIVRYSSNIGMSKIGLALGAPRLFSQLERFGFCTRTGIRVPAESKGMIRPPHQWTDVDLAAASFGQGVAITPLQMARAYVAIGNRGRMIPLHLIKDRSGDGPRVLDEEVADRILAMLKGVVEADGTGTRARIPGIQVGGKTGTAQKSDPSGGYGDKFLASFVGFIPAMHPKYFILAMVDEPHPQHYGGVVSAPVVKKVAMKLLAYRGETPPKEKAAQKVSSLVYFTGNRAAIQSRITKEDAGKSGDTVPDLCGKSLKRAVEVMVGRGVVPKITGRGSIVVRQSPRPGARWPESESGTWRLWVTTTRSKTLCR